jgi:hypothetical protein
MYRFLWENREALELAPQAYCEVISVRPCVRQGRDGFFLRETVAEYVEILRLRAGELDGVNLRAPVGVGRDQEIFLYGGGALIFDEFSQVKYHVKSHVHSARQQERLDYLAGNGFLRRDAGRRGFAEIHLERATSTTTRLPDGW